MTTALIERIDPLRAWEDPDYRDSLTAEQRAALPANPIGELVAVDTSRLPALGKSHASIIVGGVTCALSLACTWPCCAW